MIHKSDFKKRPKTIEYWRNPTKSEIKFGYGAIHYREFDFDFCFDENGFRRDAFILREDRMKYHYVGAEYFTTSRYKAKWLDYDVWSEKTSKKKR
ncbi:MAG: hypothetical protein KF900_02085 [Bacteroidetes bacterium]|nr:hypothetical protein [Bacteroidota bacterium]